jgi:hypothetical protein
MLIPAGSNSFLLLPIKNYNLDQKMDVKLFLIDESDEKFVSTGEAMINKIKVFREKSGSAPGAPTYEEVEVPQIVAWAYKTLPNKWEI